MPAKCAVYLTMYRSHGGLVPVLKKLYPSHSWDDKRFSDGAWRASQRGLALMIKQIFPRNGNIDIVTLISNRSAGRLYYCKFSVSRVRTAYGTGYFSSRCPFHSNTRRVT